MMRSDDSLGLHGSWQQRVTAAFAAPAQRCCHCVGLETAVRVIGLLDLLSAAYHFAARYGEHDLADWAAWLVCRGLGLLELACGVQLLAACAVPLLLRIGFQLQVATGVLELVSLFLVAPVTLAVSTHQGRDKSRGLVEAAIAGVALTILDIYFAYIVWSCLRARNSGAGVGRRAGGIMADPMALAPVALESMELQPVHAKGDGAAAGADVERWGMVPAAYAPPAFGGGG